MPVCLNLGLLPCSCLFSLCGFVAYWSLVPVACLVASVCFGGLFGCNHVWKHIFVIFGLLATCFSPLFLALHVRVSHIRLSMCHITFLALLLCDNMLGFLYACFVPSYLAFFICLNLYILVYLFMNVSLYVCLCLQAQVLPIISCGFTPIFVHEILSPFQELHLMAQVSSIFQYNGTTDNKSKSTVVLLGHPLLFDNMLSHPFVRFLSLFSPFMRFLCSFVISFTCLLALYFLFCCMYTLGVRAQIPKCKLKRAKCKQEDTSPKRAMFNRL